MTCPSSARSGACKDGALRFPLTSLPPPMKRSNTVRLWLAAWAGAALIAVPTLTPAQEPAKTTTTTPRLDVLQMSEVPPGNYRVNLQWEGKEHRLNFEVKDNVARCVNSSLPEWRDLKGSLKLLANGVYVASLSGEHRRATQYWIFRPDGSAEVREVPDRGEKQIAVPVSGDSIEAPAQ